LPVVAACFSEHHLVDAIERTSQDRCDSGDLENTADSVLGRHRDEMHHPETRDKGLAELIVLKKLQLGDDVGSVRRLVWVGESYRDFTYQS
jgi:hypothetical protein